MTYRAVLFDLDGTLLDTLDDLSASANRVLRANGFPEHPRDAYRYFVGDGARNLVVRILPEDRRDKETIEACLQAFRADYGENWAVRTRPYEGVPEMLDAVAGRKLPMAVFSNKPDDATKACVSEFLSRWEFCVVLGQRDGAPVKPDPSGAIESARRIGIPPSDFLYLGDTATDMKTAVRAGMFPVGALWGFRTEEELLRAGAAAIAAKPADVPDLLG